MPILNGQLGYLSQFSHFLSINNQEQGLTQRHLPLSIPHSGCRCKSPLEKRCCSLPVSHHCTITEGNDKESNNEESPIASW